MSPSAQTLYTQLAKAIGVPEIPADANGIVQLNVGEGGTVMLVPEDAYSLMLMSPVGPLPSSMNEGTLLWLMRRNFHDSPLAPFRIGADEAGTVVIWGRMPIEGMSGDQLAALLDAVAEEAALIREEIEVDETPDTDDDDDDDEES